jgi:ceramide glucosyltransferase
MTLKSLLVLAMTLVALSAPLAVWLATRSRPRPAPVAEADLPPLSVLKPVKGVDDDLEANLESFFGLDYPRFELVFGVEGLGDPVLAVLQRLRARYPRVPCRVVVHAGGRGLNPKVSNLRAMLEGGSHDAVVVSDSNVRVPANYLRSLAAHLAEPGVGLVTSPIAAQGERSLGAATASGSRPARSCWPSATRASGQLPRAPPAAARRARAGARRRPRPPRAA